MENFDLNKGYVIRNFKVSVQSVDHEDLSDWLQDGRSSPIYFKHLLAVHPNLKRYVRVSKHDPTPEHVVKLPNSKLLMVRTVTLATGVTITNYNQTGQYRKYDREKHDELRANLLGYIWIDITQSPAIITYTFVNNEDLPGGFHRFPYDSAVGDWMSKNFKEKLPVTI